MWPLHARCTLFKQVRGIVATEPCCTSQAWHAHICAHNTALFVSASGRSLGRPRSQQQPAASLPPSQHTRVASAHQRRTPLVTMCGEGLLRCASLRAKHASITGIKECTPDSSIDRRGVSSAANWSNPPFFAVVSHTGSWHMHMLHHEHCRPQLHRVGSSVSQVSPAMDTWPQSCW